MLHYVLAVIVVAAVGTVAAGYLVLRIRERQRIPSLESLRDATRRGEQRQKLRARVQQNTTAAADAMLSDLRTGKP